MADKCCIPGCSSSKPAVPLHAFPRSEKRFQTWLKAINHHDINKLSKNVLVLRRRVCRKHFEAKFIRQRQAHGSRFVLTPNAYPTLFSKREIKKGIQSRNDSGSDIDDTCNSEYIPDHLRDHIYCLDPRLATSTQETQFSLNTPEPPVIEGVPPIAVAESTNSFQFVVCDAPTMAIVEDEVRNDSEENEIEVVVEEYGDDQDSEDSEDDDDDAVDAALESKVKDLELMLKADPYSYDDHVELVKAYWALSDLERWRSAFDRFIDLMALKPEHWLLRLRTEISLSHSTEAREKIAKLFEKAIEDGYSMEILSEWCSWSLGDDNVESTRQQLKRVVEIAGADPLSGKVFWDALYEFEKAQLANFREEEHDTEPYRKQVERVCRSLEEIVSRPLLHSKDAWSLYEEVASPNTRYGAEYVAGTLKDHKVAMEFLEKITPYEDKLLTAENETEERLRIYEEYIDALEIMCAEFDSRDFDDTLKTIYERASTECPSLALLKRYANHTRRYHSTMTYTRTLQMCTRRWPKTHHFWTLQMQQAERDKKDIDTVHASFEAALLRGMETYKEGEQLWLSYIEYKRRQTDFEKQDEIDRLRSTFRLAWDSLATCYGEEANDCEVPLYWARLEYKRMNSPKEGRDVFEEIFKYGDNRTISKYWEALIRLEMNRSPPISESKLRDIFRRALKSVTDYPPAIATLWTDYERDYGTVNSLAECTHTVEKKIKEWREYYKTMKDKMIGKKNKPNTKDNKKNKYEAKNKNVPKKQETKPATNKTDAEKASLVESKVKGKRKSDEAEGCSGVKRKKEGDMEVDEPEKASNSQGVKRSHDKDEEEKDKDNKRQKVETEDARVAQREACTLFVSNLDFKVNEQDLRDSLSQYGDIVSLRVKSGVKAFGGSICYCQYKNTEAVDAALKHDRSTLNGRPMFFSRYAVKKTKLQFKYATSQEKNKLFVKNLPFAHCTKDELTVIFEPHGKLNDIRIVTHKDGKPRGLAYVDYEDEESAARAIEKTNGMLIGERKIEVAISAPPPKNDAPTTLGLAKRDAGGGMRRTQLSSFIPSVLQKAQPSTSKTANASDDNKPKSNKDFRNLLLAKKQ